MQVLPVKALHPSSAKTDPKELPFPFDLPLDEFQLEMAILRQKPRRPDHFFIFPFLLELEQRKVALVCLNNLSEGQLCMIRGEVQVVGMILQPVEKLFEGQDMIGFLIVLSYGIEGQIVQALGHMSRPVNHFVPVYFCPKMVLLGLHGIFAYIIEYKCLTGSIQSEFNDNSLMHPIGI